MDPKNRVSVPSGWRPENGKVLHLMFSKDRHGLPLVRALSQEAYDEKIATINNSDKTPAEKNHLRGKLAMLCREASVNDQNRLLVPKDLSELAGISADSEVVLVGKEIHFEIWSKTNFDKMWSLETSNKDEDDLGIF
jgi:DNA-binding transcriptional regulator/RsmH inhibitor MraZ